MTDSPAVAIQPPPVPSGHPPAWEAVIHRARAIRDRHEDAEVWDRWNRLIGDMLARDAFGRSKYGVPLAPHDGRDSLADALQEALDLCAYLEKRAAETGHLRDRMLAHDAIYFAFRIRARLDGFGEGEAAR